MDLYQEYVMYLTEEGRGGDNGWTGPATGLPLHARRDSSREWILLMRIYCGVTDTDWFDFLAAREPEDVNFWKPGAGAFQALAPGEPFLFKLKKPYNAVGGVGFFSSYSILPVSLAWDVFGERNGCTSLVVLRRMITGYRSGEAGPDPKIGCVVLTNPVFFPRQDWVRVPGNWANAIVSGKGYGTDEGYKLPFVFIIENRM